MHWTERELIISRRDVLQDKFIGRRISINTLLLYWERDLPIFWTKDGCPGFVFKRFVIFGLLFFKLESSTLEQSFQCSRHISRNKEKSKIRDTLLGFIIILTLSSNFTKLTEYQPRINFQKIKTQAKALCERKLLKSFSGRRSLFT